MSVETDQAPDSAPLTVDQAVELRASRAAPEQPKDDEPLVPQISAGPTAEDEAAPPEGAASGDDEAGQLEPSDDAPTAIEPPHSWDADAKAKFAELPAPLQEYLAKREGERDAAVIAATREAAETRKNVEAKLGLIQQVSDGLSQVLPELAQTFKSRWGDNPDWEKVAEEQGTDEAFRLKTQYDREKAQLEQVARDKAMADHLAHSKFLSDEFEKLKTLSPEMTDPVKGDAIRAEVGDYIVGQGYPREALRNISALEMTIARKAMLYDKAQAALKAPKPKAPPSPQVRPAGTPAPSSAVRSIETLERRLAQTGSVDDLVALRQARRKAAS